jgi:hypothetical protein
LWIECGWDTISPLFLAFPPSLPLSFSILVAGSLVNKKIFNVRCNNLSIFLLAKRVNMEWQKWLKMWINWFCLDAQTQKSTSILFNSNIFEWWFGWIQSLLNLLLSSLSKYKYKERSNSPISMNRDLWIVSYRSIQIPHISKLCRPNMCIFWAICEAYRPNL